ncbi:hypothetical protein ERJ75_000618400 [Trypanosoma vivax]|nr:hypothetical protein ERJ75_000618400 [Trypanosoma vivax]
MLAAWRAVCLAALLAALAATLATGADAGAGDTVRDFGLVCNVFRNVLQARGVAKAKKVRGHEVALAIEHAWLGEASEDYEVAVKYSPHNAKTKANEAQRLKKQAEDIAAKIDALSYTAILGNISNGQPDKAENESNVVFGAMAEGGDNKGFADAQSGTALSNDMMWLCNLAGADATDRRAPFKRGTDTYCPCTTAGAAAAYLKEGEFWKPLKATGGGSDAAAIAKSWTVAKRICLAGEEEEDTITQAQSRQPLRVAQALSTAVTRVMAAMKPEGKTNPAKAFCLGQRVNGQACDGNSGATACVCYDQHKGHIPWSDKIAEMETGLEELQDVMTQLDQLQEEAAGLNRTRAREATRAEKTQEASQTKNEGQRAGNGTQTQNTTPEQRGNRKKRTAEQDENNDAQKAEVAGQGNTECGPAHPAWNTDTKTCSTTRRSAHVTLILTLLATALEAQDTRMAQQILQ